MDEADAKSEPALPASLRGIPIVYKSDPKLAEAANGISFRLPLTNDEWRKVLRGGKILPNGEVSDPDQPENKNGQP